MKNFLRGVCLLLFLSISVIACDNGNGTNEIDEPNPILTWEQKIEKLENTSSWTDFDDANNGLTKAITDAQIDGTLSTPSVANNIQRMLITLEEKVRAKLITEIFTDFIRITNETGLREPTADTLFIFYNEVGPNIRVTPTGNWVNEDRNKTTTDIDPDNDEEIKLIYRIGVDIIQAGLNAIDIVHTIRFFHVVNVSFKETFNLNIELDDDHEFRLPTRSNYRINYKVNDLPIDLVREGVVSNSTRFISLIGKEIELNIEFTGRLDEGLKQSTPTFSATKFTPLIRGNFEIEFTVTIKIEEE